jgi:hypothetical protein
MRFNFESCHSFPQTTFYRIFSRRDDDEPPSSGGMTAKIGILIGIIVAVLAIVVAGITVFYFRRSSRIRRIQHRNKRQKIDLGEESVLPTLQHVPPPITVFHREPPKDVPVSPTVVSSVGTGFWTTPRFWSHQHQLSVSNGSVAGAVFDISRPSSPGTESMAAVKLSRSDSSHAPLLHTPHSANASITTFGVSPLPTSVPPTAAFNSSPHRTRSQSQSPLRAMSPTPSDKGEVDISLSTSPVTVHAFGRVASEPELVGRRTALAHHEPREHNAAGRLRTPTSSRERSASRNRTQPNAAGPSRRRSVSRHRQPSSSDTAQSQHSSTSVSQRMNTSTTHTYHTAHSTAPANTVPPSAFPASRPARPPPSAFTAVPAQDTIANADNDDNYILVPQSLPPAYSPPHADSPLAAAFTSLTSVSSEEVPVITPQPSVTSFASLPEMRGRPLPRPPRDYSGSTKR